MIDIDIDNLSDELHDRALDDFDAAIAPHLDSLRALAYARHDIACPNHTLLDLSNFDDLEHAAFDTDESDMPCIAESLAMVSPLYSFYRD